MICQNNKLCFGVFANQKIKKVHTANSVNYNRKLKKVVY